MAIFKVNILAKLKSIFWPSWGSQKKGQLGQNIDFEILARVFFIFKIVLKPLFLQCFFTSIVFEKTNLAKILTLKRVKLGQNLDSTAYIFMLWSLAKFYPFQSQYFGQVKVARVIFVFQAFFWLLSLCVCVCVCVFFVPNYLAIF